MRLRGKGRPEGPSRQRREAPLRPEGRPRRLCTARESPPFGVRPSTGKASSRTVIKGRHTPTENPEDPIPRVGSLGESHPQAPADPGVTVSRHRALLTNQSVRADPGPVSEQSGLSFLQPFPPLREPLVGPQPSILLPCPAPQVGADAS